jgi:hypothetical protein
MNLNDPDIPAINRKPLLRPSGKKVFHDITPTRFACPLPAGSPTPPVRAKAYRATKDRNAPVPDPVGTPQQAGDARDERMPRD